MEYVLPYNYSSITDANELNENNIKDFELRKGYTMMFIYHFFSVSILLDKNNNLKVSTTH